MKKDKYNSILSENENLIEVCKPNFLRTFMVNFLFLILWLVVTIILFCSILIPSDQGLGYALQAAVGVIMYFSASLFYLGVWFVAFLVTLFIYFRRIYILTNKRVLEKRGRRTIELNLDEANIVLNSNIVDKLFGLKTGGIYFYTSNNGERKTRIVFKYVRKAKAIAEKFEELKLLQAHE